jgi:pimeloyl-ACP methyl ester carboxylesterase
MNTLRPLILLFALGVALVACTPLQPEAATATQATTTTAGKTYVLVHGAFQDSLAWSEVTPRLTAAGHMVVTVDLLGRRNDPTPINEITLDSYRDKVIAAIEQQAGSVVLVGHSFVGITIAAVAEAIPDWIEALVFIAAYLPVTGDSLASLAEQDQGTKFNDKNFLLAADYPTASVLQDDVVLIFCADCSADFQQRTLDQIQPEPLGPMNTPVTVSAEKFGKVRKIYIETTQDNAVSNMLQKLMLEKTPVEKVITLATGHSPFFVDPEGLTAALLAFD